MSDYISLDELVRLKRGYDLPTRDRRAGATPILGSFGVTGWHDEAKVDGPGVTIGRSGASIGVATYSSEPYWPLNTTLYVEDFKGNHPRFVYFTLDSIDFRSFNSGAAQPSLNRNYLGAISVWCPDYNVQAAIAEVLGAFDDLIENNRRRIEVLEEVTRLLYQEWFVQFRFPGHEAVAFVDSNLGPIPETWEAGVFADLVSEVRQTVDPEEIPISAPVVGLEHLPRRSTTLQRWAAASSVGSRRKVFEQGDILFAKIRPYFHKVVDAPFMGYASTDAIVFRPKSASLGARALAVASSDDFVDIATATSNGTRMPRANTELLMSYGVPHPSPPIEQAFGETVGPMDRLRKKLADQSRCLSKARDLLLPRLVSGELDISDLNLELEAVGV
ncbi:MAG: restriction endonuclease subunit S [Acidimicrobiaceae bacterium]|nr:restriction endonuclease subunit S [Acidimicrobiaceae bacterium]